MTAYWLAQGVGVIAFLIGITTFFNRDERRFKKQLSVYSAVFWAPIPLVPVPSLMPFVR